MAVASNVHLHFCQRIVSGLSSLFHASLLLQLEQSWLYNEECCLRLLRTLDASCCQPFRLDGPLHVALSIFSRIDVGHI